MLLTSFYEVLSVGGILPFLGVLTSPERIFQMPVAQLVIQALKITEPTQLLLPMTVALGTSVFKGIVPREITGKLGASVWRL